MSYTLAAISPEIRAAFDRASSKTTPVVRSAGTAKLPGLPMLPEKIRAAAVDDLNDAGDDKSDNTKLIAGVAVAGLVAYFLLK